jgi:hypothetical protein
VSSAPLITPLRRIADTTVTAPIANPIHGSERAIRLDIRAPAHLMTRSVFDMKDLRAKRIPPVVS